MFETQFLKKIKIVLFLACSLMAAAFESSQHKELMLLCKGASGW